MHTLTHNLPYSLHWHTYRKYTLTHKHNLPYSESKVMMTHNLPYRKYTLTHNLPYSESKVMKAYIHLPTIKSKMSYKDTYIYPQSNQRWVTKTHTKTHTFTHSQIKDELQILKKRLYQIKDELQRHSQIKDELQRLKKRLYQIKDELQRLKKRL